MTVKELIEELSKLPQDADILLWSFATGELEDPFIMVHDNADEGVTVSHIELVAKSDHEVE